MGLYPLEVEGVEGDDVIATLVDRLCETPAQQQQKQPEEGEFDEVVVATVDKDLLQLLRYNYESMAGRPLVKVLALHRQFRLVDQQFVRDEYGVYPHQLLDFFSLVGDRADGIVGCRGIGMAAARKVLQAVDGLEALIEAPDSLKQVSLRSSQLSSLLAFLPQWEINRRLVALDCGVVPARAASLADFRLRHVGVEALRKMFAPYNLSKQADLWVQAGGGIPSATRALQSPPPNSPLSLPKPSLTVDISLPAPTSFLASPTGAAADPTPAALRAEEVSLAAARPAVAAHRAAVAVADGIAAVPAQATGGGKEEASDFRSTLRPFASCRSSGAPSAYDLMAHPAISSLLRGTRALLPIGRLHTGASEEQEEEAAAATTSERLTTATPTLVAARRGTTTQDTTYSVIGSNSDNESVWGFLSALWPSGLGVPVFVGAHGASVPFPHGEPRSRRLGRGRLALLLDLHRINQRRLLSSAAEAARTELVTSASVVAPPNETPAATALPSQALFAAATGATEGIPAKDSAKPFIAARALSNTPGSSLISNSISKAANITSNGGAVRSGEAANTLEFQLPRLPVKTSTSRSDNSTSSNAPADALAGSETAATSAIAIGGNWKDHIRCLLHQEWHHVEALQRHMRHQQQAAAAVEAAATAAAIAAGTTLKVAKVRAARAASRQVSNSDDYAFAATAAVSGSAATSDADTSSWVDGQSGHRVAAAAADARPLLPPIECRASFASSPPLQQAEDFRSTLFLCLRYLSLVPKVGEVRDTSSSSNNLADAMAVADGLLRQLPEPVPIDPLQMSLSIMGSTDTSSNSTDSRPASQCSSFSSGSSPDSASLLLPVSVAWLAASPSRPHAPASALCPLHLTFSVCLPCGLLQFLFHEQQPEFQLPLHLQKQGDLIHFHFEVSRLLEDPEATRLLRHCLKIRNLRDLSPLLSSHLPSFASRAERSMAERAVAPATEARGSPRVVWAVHDAKQLLHLLLNVGLCSPPMTHVHCTSVLAWLLHGADSKTSDLLQQATLYWQLQQHQPQKMLHESPTASAPSEIGETMDLIDTHFNCEGQEQKDEKTGESLDSLASPTGNAERREEIAEGSTRSLLGLLGSPFASLIVEVMTKEAAALASVQRRGRGAAKAAGGADGWPLMEEAYNRAPMVQTPWHSMASARHSLLPPEQNQLQQGLFGRFGWGIYSKLQKKTQGTILKDSSTMTIGTGLGLRLGFQPIVAISGAPGTALDEINASTSMALETDHQLSQGHAASSITSNNSIRFPPRFKRCCPPRRPESLDPQDIQAFCEARSAATLVLLESQQQLLQQQQHAAEERLPYPRETGCLSLAWGVWAQVERPLLPALVAVERRGLSLSTSVLTDGWRAERGRSLLVAEDQQEDVPYRSVSPSAGKVTQQEEFARSTAAASDAPELHQSKDEHRHEVQVVGDCREALEQQRQLERRIWKQIERLTGSGEININSPSQLAALLFDVLELPSPPLAFQGASNLKEKPQSNKGSKASNSSGTNGSRSTGAEALQALLRAARSNEPDSRNRQIAALLSALLEYRASHKFVSTYFASLPSYIFPPTNRIHVSLLQTGASTGRLACRSPNLQNIPNNHEEWRWIRRAFIPCPVQPCRAVEGAICGDALSDALASLRPGTHLAGEGRPPPVPSATRGDAPLPSPSPASPWRFLSIDYSQMELHILAYLSNDLQLLSDLRGGDSADRGARRFDSFQLTASRLFGCRPEEVTKERRSAAKTVTYGILYGQTEGGLSRQLQVPLKDARRLIDCFFSEYPGVQTLTRTHTQFAEATGTIETLVGRSRRLDGTEAVAECLLQHAQLAALLQHIGAARKPLPQKILANRIREGSRSRCRRQAMNTPIQGLAADIMKYATARVEQLLHQQQQQAFNYQHKQQRHLSDSKTQPKAFHAPHWALARPVRAQVVLQIHDELLLEVHEEDVQLTLELVLPVMRRAWGLLLVETGCLDRYAALCHVQRRFNDSHEIRTNEGDAMMHSWALQAAGNPSRANEQKWFSLPSHYEWLRPLLQRTLPTSAKVGSDWAHC